MIFRKEQPIPEEAVSLREQRAMLGDRLSFAASEAYKLLRTNLTFALPDEKKCRVVGVTSAMRGEGKSTTSINLAYTLAETGKKVLLIEADMRRPNLAVWRSIRLRVCPICWQVCVRNRMWFRMSDCWTASRSLRPAISRPIRPNCLVRSV